MLTYLLDDNITCCIFYQTNTAKNSKKTDDTQTSSQFQHYLAYKKY